MQHLYNGIGPNHKQDWETILQDWYFDAHPHRPPHTNKNFFTPSCHHATFDNSLQLTCNLICRRAISVRNVAIPFFGVTSGIVNLPWILHLVKFHRRSRIWPNSDGIYKTYETFFRTRTLVWSAHWGINNYSN